jgi:hypothetical protein
VHMVTCADRKHTEGQTTWGMRISRQHLQRVPMRRAAETALLLKARGTAPTRTTTPIHILQCAIMDEQPTCAHGCGVELNTHLLRGSKGAMGKLPTWWNTRTKRNTTWMAHHLLWMWMVRTLCERLPPWATKLSLAGAR